MFSIKGKIAKLYPVQQIKENFKKREFVVAYEENLNYPEYLKFELIQDRCDLLDGFKENREVEVFFNLKGRKWTDPKGQEKYFNSLHAWKINPLEEESKDVPDTAEEWIAEGGTEEEDDLPF